MQVGSQAAWKERKKISENPSYDAAIKIWGALKGEEEKGSFALKSGVAKGFGFWLRKVADCDCWIIEIARWRGCLGIKKNLHIQKVIQFISKKFIKIY